MALPVVDTAEEWLATPLFTQPWRVHMAPANMLKEFWLASKHGATAIEPDGESPWINDLANIHTYYGRLVYLAAIRNADNGRYEHFRFITGSSTSLIASGKLKRIHERLFMEWVNSSLEAKAADIALYVSTIEGVDKRLLIDTWLRLTPYLNLVPASIHGPERQRHISDSETILGLLQNVHGVASPV
jgi:hypothetical protein